MRKSAAIFNAAEQQSGAVRQPGGPSIENAVHLVRPVFSAQDGVRGMPLKKCFVVVHYHSRARFQTKNEMALKNAGSDGDASTDFLGLVVGAV
jgi:hypothetical protein